jgi:hypothetical protein
MDNTTEQSTTTLVDMNIADDDQKSTQSHPIETHLTITNESSSIDQTNNNTIESLSV